MKKRILSLLLVFVMAFTMLPIPAMAALANTMLTAAADSNPFTDVKKSDWYYDAVQYARVNGFFNGTSATTFDPDGTMTRGMFVTVLGRMAGVDTEQYAGQSAFTDVDPQQYYAPYVAWAAKHGITSGTGEGTFSPDALITREMLATFFVRYFEIFNVAHKAGTGSDTEPKDLDNVSDWAKESVLKLWKMGLLNGDGKNFNPAANATRAEAATLCMRTDDTVLTWYKEPGVASDRISIDPATGKPVDGETEDDETDESYTDYYMINFAMADGISGEGVSLPENKLYKEGYKISGIPTPYKQGSIFLGWYYDAAMEDAVLIDDVVSRNMTLYAKMADAASVAEESTPNYVTVTVPADELETWSFRIVGYEEGCIDEFIQVTKLNEDVDYTVNGEVVTAPYEAGQTYSVRLNELSGAVFYVNNAQQPDSIDVLNIITEKGEVHNLELDNEMKYLPAGSISNMTGTALDGLFTAAVAEDSVIQQNKNEGTFQYGGSDIQVGDTVAI